MKVPLQWGCMERLIHFVEISFVRVVFFLYDRERNQTNPGLSFLVSRMIVMDFRVPYITISIDALSISVSAVVTCTISHLFDAVPWSIDLLGSSGSIVMWNIRDSPDSILGWGGVSFRRKLGRLRSAARNWRETSTILSAPSVWRTDWSWYGLASYRSSSRT